MLKTVNIGFIGLGTVGCGALQILRANAAEITARLGRELKVTRIAVRDLHKSRSIDTGGINICDAPMQIVNAPEVDIVVELMGGDTVALAAVMQALQNGKHVVTANKALIAMHGNAIFKQGRQHNAMVAFEAAVAGGIPIIKAIREGLAANKINWLAGIINGTCNYILTRMQADRLDFDNALKAAQQLGYAEADPAFDINGIDAAHKLTILAATAFGIPLQFDKVHIEGITAITIDDIAFAEKLGFKIKHLGLARRTDSGIALRVHPAMVPSASLIANVDGVMNAVMVQADAAGATLYYGAGAGAAPTGSAVVADIVELARNLDNALAERIPYLGFQPEAIKAQPILAMGEVETAYYLRMKVVNVPGVLASITRIFGDSDISIATILQQGYESQGHASPNGEVTIIMLTQITLESHCNTAIRQVEALDTVTSSVTSIRLESLV